MKNYHKNPRNITDIALEDLKTWMRELGDLGGIVHNLPSDEIISGNQRMKVIDFEKAEIQLNENFNPPTIQGTVALGYVLYQGEKFAYRQVSWTAEQCERAVIIANKAGGEWDNLILKEQFDESILKSTGFSAEEIEGILAAQSAEIVEEPSAMAEVVYPITPKFSEQYDAYIIVSTNEIDSNFIREVLQIGLAQSYKSKDVGMSHIINAKKFADLWKSKS